MCWVHFAATLQDMGRWMLRQVDVLMLGLFMALGVEPVAR
jgi:hypothetical protein